MLPYCDTCRRSVTLEEVQERVHDGHSFSVIEASAMAVLRLYFECDQCPRKDACGTSEQLCIRITRSSDELG
jgi:hypothetical protein